MRKSRVLWLLAVLFIAAALTHLGGPLTMAAEVLSSRASDEMAPEMTERPDPQGRPGVPF